MNAVAAPDGATLIGGGAVTADDLADARALAPLLVAADGGADAALALGATPAAVIGDLDSVSDAGRAAAGRVLHVPEQDSTDFAKALRHLHAPFVIAIGFAGRRLDHTLAALTVMAADPRPVLMLAAEDVVFRLPARLSLPLVAGTRVSLWPLGPAQGTSRGLHWPIDGIAMTPSGRVGTSNRAKGPVTLTVAGPMLALLPRDHLRLALRALQAAALQPAPSPA